MLSNLTVLVMYAAGIAVSAMTTSYEPGSIQKSMNPVVALNGLPLSVDPISLAYTVESVEVPYS